MATIFSVPLFIAGAISFLIFIVFAFLKTEEENKRSFALFSTLSLINTLFLIFYGLTIAYSQNIEIVNITNRVTVIMSMFTVVLSLHFIQSFYKQTEFIFYKNSDFQIFYYINVFFTILSLLDSDLFLKKAIFHPNETYFGLQFGILFQLWGLYLLSLLMYALWRALLVWQTSKNTQTNYHAANLLVFSYAVWVIGGIIDTLSSVAVISALPSSWVGSILVVLSILFIILNQRESFFQQLRIEIDHHKSTEQALRVSEQRYALAAKAANDGLWDWDIIVNTVYFSTRWKSMLGYDEDDIGQSPDDWFELVHIEDVDRLKTAIETHFAGSSSHFECEFRMRHKQDYYRWVICRGMAVKNDEGENIRMAGSITDVSERKSYEDQLLHDAFHDQLTSLPNRFLFVDRLQHLLLLSKKSKQPFAVMLLDIDRFKVINDSLGHLFGDEVLIAIAKRLEQVLTQGDTLARFGGDEFTLLLESIDSRDSIIKYAEKINDILAEPFLLKGKEIHTHSSVGLVFGPGEYKDAEHIIRDVDIAMYKAKSHGGGRYQLFDQTMHQNAMARLELENDIHKAIDDNQLFVVYQPIVAIDEERLVGFEALIRWQHPKYGLVSPAEFIPIAEEVGLVIDIDRWVMISVCRQLEKWVKKYPDIKDLVVSVNFSAYHFSQHDLLERLQELFKKEQIDLSVLSHLKLEITETIIMENPEMATQLLNDLRAMNIKFSLDDFGTGYSSFSYLHRFPVNTLKIDRSFVIRMCLDNDGFEIVRVLVLLAHALNLNVIAEGAESKEQKEKLKRLGCEFIQGQYYSLPVSLEQADKWLEEQPWMIK